ncbi:DUF1972 domain-containing protein [Escherichia coli]
MVCKVAVVGTVGLPACYGGFESLVDNLIKHNDKDIEYTVFCSSKYYKNKINSYMGAKLIYLPINANGVSSIFYDMLSLTKCIVGKFDVILILGVSGCIFLPLFRLMSDALIITNIDGMEWRRQKWGKIARKFLKLSESVAVKYSDIVVSDNQVIVDYVKEEYGVESKNISYGGDHALCNHIDKEALVEDDYYISICRIEPENNVHLILEAFSKSEQKIKFIGNWNANDYGIQLKRKYSKYSNIDITDPVYDLDILYSFRCSCKGYVHGHSAGGTNPSLVEAMHFGKTVIAFDCGFNRHTTGNEALYFNNAESLFNVINNENVPSNGEKMIAIAQKSYTWDIISKQYKHLFTMSKNKK